MSGSHAIIRVKFQNAYYFTPIGVKLVPELAKPSACGCDDFVGVGFPAEGFGVGFVVGEVSVDGGLQIDDADEGVASEASLGQRGEEPLHRVQP